MQEILRVENLAVQFDGAPAPAVRGVSFVVDSGEILALVGESGSGKSVTAQSILGLNPTPPARVSAQVLRLDGQDVLHLSEKELGRIRGSVGGMVFQDPLTCLNPTMKVGRQITERLYRREKVSAARCREEAIRLLNLVRIVDAPLRAEQYPHQLSGGMRQRVMLAMALSCNPKLLIADEPTTALDVTTQLQILGLLAGIRRDLGTAVLLITHDLGVVANLADRVAVMYAGKIVEQGETAQLFAAPAHPYTGELLSSLSRQSGGDAAEEGLDVGATPLSGCPFAPRCPHCMKICLRTEPPLFPLSGGRAAACWRLHESFPKENADGATTA